MWALDSLRLPFARTVVLRFQLPRIRAPMIGVQAHDPKRFTQLPQLHSHGIRAPTEHVCQNLTRLMIDSMPQPPGACFLPT